MALLGSSTFLNGSPVTAAAKTSVAKPWVSETSSGSPPASSENRLLLRNARHCALRAGSELNASERPTVSGSIAVPRCRKVARIAVTRSCPSKLKAREKQGEIVVISYPAVQ